MADHNIDDILKTVYDSDGSIDIREHLELLKQYASECNSVTELGVRWVVSTWYFMAGRPKKLTSFDITHFKDYGVNEHILNEVASENGVDFLFIQEDVLTTDKLQETDLLFIDTLHSYKQLKMELHLHGNKANKYLIFHDVISFGEIDEAPTPVNPEWSEELATYHNSLKDHEGINQAIVEFLLENKHWHIDKLAVRSNGLMVLRRD